MAGKRTKPEVYQALVATVGAAVLLALMYWRLFAYYAQRWLGEDAYRHCPLAIAIVAWLIWRQRARLAKARIEPSYSGLFLLAAGLGLYIVGARIGARVVMGSSLPIVLLGLTGAMWGSSVLRLTAFPLLLSFFMIPIPRHALGLVAFPMQVISAKATGILARLSGLPVIVQGVNMQMSGFTFQVAQECSGLNSLMALILATGVIVELMNLTTRQKIAVFAVVPGIVLVSNIVRLLSVLWLARFLSPDLALASLVHGTSDIVVYSMAVIFVLLAINVVTQPWWAALVRIHLRPHSPATAGARQAQHHSGAGE